MMIIIEIQGTTNHGMKWKWPKKGEILQYLNLHVLQQVRQLTEHHKLTSAMMREMRYEIHPTLCKVKYLAK